MSIRSLLVGVLTLIGVCAQATANPPEPPRADTDNGRLVTRVYHVVDLIMPLGNLGVLPVKALPPSAGPTAKACPMGCFAVAKETASTGVGKRTTEDQLIKLIMATVQFQTWSQNGGRATIDYCPKEMALVVTQTPDAQEQIAELLAGLRRLQDSDVVVEPRLVTVSDACIKRLEESTKQNQLRPRTITHVTADGVERVGIDFEAAHNPADASAGAPMKVWFLNDSQVAQFLEFAQVDRRTSVLSSPNLTVANGQASTIDLTDKQLYITGVTKRVVDGQIVIIPRTEAIATGWKWSLQPTVSADRRYVKVRVLVSQAGVASPVPLLPIVTPVTPILADGNPGEPVAFTQYIQQPKVTHQEVHATLAIPDGGTAVLGGWTRQRQSVSEIGPPVLSKVPYVNRLFKNVAYAPETEHILVLVTPRIIKHEQEEQAIPVDLSGLKLGALLGNIIEKEDASSTKKKTHASDAAMSSQKRVAQLLEKYHQACAEGRLEDAKKLARRALTLDPTCFDKQGYAR